MNASLSHLPLLATAIGLAIAGVSCDGCSRDDTKAPPVDDVAAVPDPTRSLTPQEEADAIALVVARIPTIAGACAQVRSLKDRAEAEAVQKAIVDATSLPVRLLDKDLGARGVWTRVCVGAEADAARLTAEATRWTAPGGVLAPFLDPPRSPDEPRFLVLEVEDAVAPRSLPRAQAIALLSRSNTGAVYALGAAADALLAATGHAATPSPDGEAGSETRVVVVDAAGIVHPMAPEAPPGCASCQIAEQQSPITSRRLLGVGALLPTPGLELLVEEETADGARFLAVVSTDGPTLRRRAEVLLSSTSTEVILRGEAFVVEADGDDDREIAVARLELRRQGDNVCALERHAEVWQTTDSARGLEKLTPTALLARWSADKGTGPGTNDANAGKGADGADAAFVDFMTALDVTDDADAASRACATFLSARPSTLVNQFCLQRIRTLITKGRLIEAVNAAGALAERAGALRAAVASPLFSAMTALDNDPRLSAAPYDCEAAPLLKGLGSRPIEANIAMARARLNERLSLADVADAVFVTANRDFGAATPVGGIAARWMERLRIAQPARHAAIEAALLPPQDLMPELGSGTGTDTGTGSGTLDLGIPADGSPGFGGAP